MFHIYKLKKHWYKKMKKLNKVCLRNIEGEFRWLVLCPFDRC